jgi:hypothetical protein
VNDVNVASGVMPSSSAGAPDGALFPWHSTKCSREIDGRRCNALLAAGFNLRQLLRFLNRVPYFLRAFFCLLLATFHHGSLHPAQPITSQTTS